MRPGNLKRLNRDAKICVGRSRTMHNRLFCTRTLCMNDAANTFLLVSSSVQNKEPLCFVHGQSQENGQEHTTKNCVGFHNLSPLLTMIIHMYFEEQKFVVKTKVESKIIFEDYFVQNGHLEINN